MSVSDDSMMGVLYDDDGIPGAESHPAFTVYDSFGNNMTASPLGKGGPQGGLEGAGSYAWRGGEGSVTDREPNLVHMQARHYDPTLGRFIQADTLMLASMTTQGMNRYIYTENDPVNRSDPGGSFWLPLLMIVGTALLGGLQNAWKTPLAGGGFNWSAFWSGALGGAISAASALFGGWALGPIGAWLIGALGNALGSAISAAGAGCTLAQQRQAWWIGLALGIGLGFLSALFAETAAVTTGQVWWWITDLYLGTGLLTDAAPIPLSQPDGCVHPLYGHSQLAILLNGHGAVVQPSASQYLHVKGARLFSLDSMARSPLRRLSLMSGDT